LKSLKHSITINTGDNVHTYYVDADFAGEILFMCEASTSAQLDDIQYMLRHEIMLDEGGCSMFDWDETYGEDDEDEEDNDDWY